MNNESTSELPLWGVSDEERDYCIVLLKKFLIQENYQLKKMAKFHLQQCNKYKTIMSFSLPKREKKCKHNTAINNAIKAIQQYYIDRENRRKEFEASAKTHSF